ncbi:hypothetical protein ACNO7T_15710 [Vibrio campbellii]
MKLELRTLTNEQLSQLLTPSTENKLDTLRALQVEICQAKMQGILPEAEELLDAILHLILVRERQLQGRLPWDIEPSEG